MGNKKGPVKPALFLLAMTSIPPALDDAEAIFPGPVDVALLRMGSAVGSASRAPLESTGSDGKDGTLIREVIDKRRHLPGFAAHADNQIADIGRGVRELWVGAAAIGSFRS